MASATAKKKAEPAEPMTFAEIAARRMAEKIELYRAGVRRTAAGEQLSEEQLSEVLDALDAMALPPFTFERDVAAVRDYAATDKSLAEALERKPMSEARLSEVVARIQAIEAELKELRAERYTLAEVEPMTRASGGRRMNELRLNHPHIFESLADAARMRLAAKEKAIGGRPVPSTSATSWSIGQ